MAERESIIKKSDVETKIYKSESGVIIGDTTPHNPKVTPTTKAPSAPVPQKK